MATEESKQLVYIVILSLSLFEIFVDGKIYSSNKVDDFRIVSISQSDTTPYNLHSRTRRKAPDTDDHKHNAPINNLPILNRTTAHLKGANHNEAIVRWSGSGKDGIFVLTRMNGLQVMDSTLWRSIDYGSSFTEVQFPKDVVINMFYVSKENYKKMVFTDVKNKMLYLTENETDTTPIPVHLAFSPDKIVFHPYKKDFLLAYSYSTTTLYMSEDLGRNWTVVHERVSNDRFFWGVEEMDADFYKIHMEVMDENTGLYHYIRTTSPYIFHEHIMLENIDPNSLLVEDQYIFAQKTMHGQSSLYVSYNRAPFKLAHFPGTLHPKNFVLLDTNEEQSFLAVEHTESSVHIYQSDRTGTMYTMVIDNVVTLRGRGGSFMVDFYEVKGVKGTLICNHYINSKQVTKISFNKGRDWKRLNATTKHCQAKDGCYLNLHLWYSSILYQRNYILSEANAPGLIIAQGMEGPVLLPTNSSVYISRDNGITWDKVFDGEYKVGIVDYGGAMVAIKENATSSSLMYSYTEGVEWRELSFTDKALHVNGLIGEPGIKRLIISIYGHIKFGSGWEIIKLDFSSILSRKCVKDDYTTWSPTDKLSAQCILGEHFEYERLKTNAECFNGQDYDRKLNDSVCRCTQEDFECDFGYEKFSAGCQKAKWFDSSVPIVDCPEGSTYLKSKGYRKIAGDKCSGDEVEKQFAPVETRCPVMAPANLALITVHSHMATTGQLVNFSLEQGMGSKTSTSYTWRNSHDSTPVTATGFEASSSRLYKFDKAGVYTISVTANNSAGTASTSVTVKVEDEIDGIDVELTHAAAVGKMSPFTVRLVTDAGHMHATSGHPYFVWDFGDGSGPLLTYSSDVTHMYHKPGNFSASITASNAVSSHFRSFVVAVYAEIVTVQMYFTANADRNYFILDIWHTEFAFALQKAITEVLNIDSSRFRVSILPVLPTRADISILPVKQDSVGDSSIDQLSKALISAVNSNQIRVLLGGYIVINATSAKILTDNTPPEVTSSNVAVYISIPILFVACCLVLLICLYYKRKMSQSRRYAVLATGPGEDADPLLDQDDDDDQLLDISSAAHLSRQENNAISDPVLRFMSGQGEQESQTTIQC